MNSEHGASRDAGDVDIGRCQMLGR
jgi:hypothetical protein